MKERQTNDLLRFGDFLLDVKKRRLLKGDELIALTPKEFDVLLYLVERAGRVAEKDDLLEAVWKEVYVEENVLARNISWLRKKLGEAGDGAKYIETVPKRGYRFAAQVTITDDADFVIEEKIVRRISVEETVSISDSGFEISDVEDRPKLPPRDERLIAANPDQNPKSKIPNPKSLWLALGVVTIAAVGFALYLAFYQKHSTKIVFANRVVPFTGLPGMEAMPAFSPDSKQIVFGWNGGEGEIFDLYVKIVGAGEPVRLTRGTSSAYFPVFTPDGRNIAFFRSSPETSVIYSISALGGAERKICNVQSGGTGFSFAPDGKTIATADRDAETGMNGIFLVNAETCAKNRLTTPPEKFTDHTPRFSPDGKSIVFVRTSSWDNQDLFIVETSGANKTRRLTLDGSRLSGFSWSADGKRVVFSSTRGESSLNLWQIAAAGGEPELLMAGGKKPQTPVAAPDGKSIAFVEEQQDLNVWQYQIGEEGKPSAARRLIASTRDDYSPNISPDSKRIVFTSLRTGETDIWTAAADGSNPLRLANGNSPRISPDGKFVVFCDNEAINLIGVDGGAARPLIMDSAHNHSPAWSADGRWIYFTSDRDGKLNIWRIAADGTGDAKQITRQGAYKSFAALDGKLIYYTKDQESKGLWRVSADGADVSGEQEIAELAAEDLRNSWTVTKSGIYFINRVEQPIYKINFFDFATNRIREIVTTGKTPPYHAPSLSVSDDGRTILYAQFDQNAASIMLAEIN